MSSCCFPDPNEIEDQDQNQEEFPSIVEQGKNLSKTAVDIIRETLQGQSLFADSFEQQRRFDICQACEHFFAPQARCKMCGCFMKKKVEFSATKCPADKW